MIYVMIQIILQCELHTNTVVSVYGVQVGILKKKKKKNSKQQQRPTCFHPDTAGFIAEPAWVFSGPKRHGFTHTSTLTTVGY